MIVKTNWNGNYNSKGEYIGDHFDYEDYNRILDNAWTINNAAMLYREGEIIRPPFIGTPKDATEWMHYEDWELILQTMRYEANFLLIENHFRELSDNSNFFSAEELNYIELVMYKMNSRYVELIAHKPHREHFAKHFGTRGGL